jgi:hypothetical protein
VKLVPGVIGSTNLLKMSLAIPAPIEKGKSIPPSEIMSDVRALFRIEVISISNPTRKRKRTSPILAVKLKKGSESLGKMCSVKCGIRPRILGPRTIPPMTSEITRG